ncbi:MAG: PilW family protein [Burkholderiales bacterium]|nr:PilW family protein [Burkholderiales bacterium]
MWRVNGQRGFSLVELMVGVTVGLLAVYATYRIYENVERNYRAVETVNEAQMAGLYATFVLSHELGNAGSGVMSNYGVLRACTTVPTFPTNEAGSPPFPLYPLPVAIIPDVVNTLVDDVFVFYGTGNFTDKPISVSAVTPPNVFSLRAPLGLAQGSVLVAPSSTIDCAAFVAANVTNAGDGIVNITVGTNQLLDGVVHAGDSLIDLGGVARRRFYVDNNETLQMEVWEVNASAGHNNWKIARVVPIASNVVAFKAQYGISDDDSDVITRWMTPDGATLAAIIGATPALPAENIKAIRFGLIVRAAEPDIELRNDTGTDVIKEEFFFQDCSVGMTCDNQPGGMRIDLLVSEAGQAYGWRYRKYETTTPLLNTVWNWRM